MRIRFLVFTLLLSAGTPGCSGDKGAKGEPGLSCTVSTNDAGVTTISCEDGTQATVSDGTPGTSCTVTDDQMGTKTIRCDDGTEATVTDGKPPSESKGEGLNVAIATSAPANGQYFAAGEKIVITIVATDDDGEPVPLSNLSRFALYMAGPKSPLLTKTASKLINASTDREAEDRQHHYVDLLTTKNENLSATGTVLTYTTESVSDEAPGTYSIGIWAISAIHEADQLFALHEVQLKSATVETEIVSGCADCHLGADSGQFYFHHVDPGRSQYGNPALDSVPIDSCRMCHNNEGYAAYRACSDGSPLPCTGDATEVRVPDPILRRVHGVHNGANLSSPFNTDPSDGDFHDYSNVHFPADIRNCAKCHVDDSYLTKPSRLACGTCHDNVNFATGKLEPPRIGDSCETTDDCLLSDGSDYTCNTSTGNCELAIHKGGSQTNDSGCIVCHTATPGDGLSPTPDRHALRTYEPPYNVSVSLSAPSNGTHYVAGESPVLTLRFTDSVTGNAVDPRTFTEDSFQRAQLFVSGPRHDTRPVLTSAAESDYSGTSYVYVDYRVRTDAQDEDPRITRTAEEVRYQLSDVAGLSPGTYTVMTRARVRSGTDYVWTVENFQVGTATPEARIATNCIDCHEDTRMHGYAPFDPDLCKSCHDDDRNTPGAEGPWGTGNNWGFGAMPISRRVHGIHYGNYLSHPEQVYLSRSGGVPFADAIFPQDVRNCSKCHAESKSYQEEPSRLACLGCHDSDPVVGHANLMTADSTPSDPWSGDEIESCPTCHAGDAEFSVEAAHKISDPYVPPYPREPLFPSP